MLQTGQSVIARGRSVFSRIGPAFVLFTLVLFALGAGMFAGNGAALAQDRRQNAPGEFDFYVLSLSWSPSFCAAAQERGTTGRNQQLQCGERPYSFVVHGL